MTTPTPAPDTAGQAEPTTVPYGDVPPQAGPAPFPYAPQAAPAPAGNLGLAVAAAVGATVVGALAYGFVTKATDHEIGWIVFGLAAAVAAALAKIGGRNPLLPPIGVVLSVAGLFLGQLFAVALVVHEILGVSIGDLFLSDFGKLVDLWKDSRGFMDVVFYGLAAFEGFVLTKRFAN